MITLSKTRVKKLQKELEKRTIDKIKKDRKITLEQASRNIAKFLYEGEYSWATSCLGTINVYDDILEIDKFMFDCLRACNVWTKENKKKTKIGGLGSANNLSDKTILRGKGRDVRYLREHTDKYIGNYYTMCCLSNNLKISKAVFNATVRNMKG